ncbi:MAG: NUDIX domain-containing protein, partial [Candidatus Vogelbacteria bacterium]|nr:NUDIX domain-containing protein [Candidatus Vogelbacteria bacterium]
GQNTKEKCPFLFRRNWSRANPKSKEHFSLVSAEALRGGGGTDSFVQFPLEKGSRKVYNYSTKTELMPKQATICLAIRNGKVFLAKKKRGFGVGLYNGYGGKVGLDETSEAAALREIKEESGATVNALNLKRVALINFKELDKPLFNCTVYIFDEWEGELKETEEMTAPQEFNEGELPFDKMEESDRLWMSKVLQGERLCIEVIYSEGRKSVKNIELKTLEENINELRKHNK